MPKISVLMGIYNCEATLSEAIEAILCQTYSDWELIMCDDGSLDQTVTVAERYQMREPQRIKLIKNNCNRGLNYTLNRCLKLASGKYIARMDGDDICTENRFELEVSVLEREREIAIVSSDMEFFDERGVWGKISHPDYPQKKDFVFESPFCHAPCMVKKEAFEAVGGYSEENRLLRVEDYHLWYKMYMKGYRGKNIHKVLYQMRDDRNAYNRRKFKYRINEAHVKIMVVRDFGLPLYDYLYALRPIAVGLLPYFLYDYLHKKRYGIK